MARTIKVCYPFWKPRCRYLPAPDLLVKGAKEVPEGKGYTLQLTDLDKDQVVKILDLLGADKSKLDTK